MTFFPKLGDLPERITLANEKSVLPSADYVLVVLNRALRGEDNPVIDAAIAHANSLGLGIVVYNELDTEIATASDRLCYFTLGAFRELAIALVAKNIKCVQIIKQAEDRDILQLFASSAAAIYSDEDYTHWDRAKIQRVLNVASQAVYLVDAARLVPTRKLPPKLKTTPEFRKAHGTLREDCLNLRKEVWAAELTAINNNIALPIEHNFAQYDDAALKETIAQCNINHNLPISQSHPPLQTEIKTRLETLKTSILAKYKWIRNNPALEYSTSELSPYMHFGMLSPHQLLATIEASEVPKSYTWKFRDEFLTWREWSHYLAFYTPNIHQYNALPDRAKETLEAHAADERSDLTTRENIIQGNTVDATWNAAQKEWLKTGWLHNNLRMYWSKQILRFTASPQAAWELACYINDYISLDGRDPATYASIQWAFGNGKPGYSEKPIYGLVAPKSDRAILKREGMKEWIEAKNHP